MIGPKARESRAQEAVDYTDTGAEAERRRAAEQSMEADRLAAVDSAILSTPDGRAWMWALIQSTGAMADHLVAELGTYQMGFYNGRRSIGEGLVRRIAKASPENFARMIAEQDSQ